LCPRSCLSSSLFDLDLSVKTIKRLIDMEIMEAKRILKIAMEELENFRRWVKQE
jgi:hypothetical protein